MCGIIAVLRRAPGRVPPPSSGLLGGLDEAVTLLGAGGRDAAAVRRAAAAVAAVDRDLRGTPGVQALLADAGLAPAVRERTARLRDAIRSLEAGLAGAARRGALGPEDMEAVNAALVVLKDALWALERDRLPAADAVTDLAGASPGRAAIEAFTSVRTALAALDRLEVRGRDSAGLHLLVIGHGLDLGSEEMRHLMGDRTADPLFTSLAVRTPAGHLSLVYKAAAEIGDLGDNTAALRQAIRDDALLHLAVQADGAECAVLGHTRWASVGIISQPNAHPLNQEEEAADGPYVVAALNGDVDNYAELIAAEGLRIPPAFTTDAKVIPPLVSRRLAAGDDLRSAFASTVARFDGSVAVAAAAADQPDRLLLALKGSGQALYVGLAEDAFVVASEPYGLVEETSRYLRMDGEATGGQVVVLDRAGAGTLAGIERFGYDGAPQPVAEADLMTAEITTRDIDRSGYPHFLLKELAEAPESFRKTLRGRIVERPGAPGLLDVRLGDALPEPVRRGLRDGEIRRIVVVGQGTAGVAAQAVASAMREALGDAPVRVDAMPATELSGFALDDDMADVLLVPISQSGTTTDTNRTVDLVRSRGAAVVGIVNRRNSDLVEKADGVLYTSDGRDVEMAVPSTKAFYSQVAAGFLLAAAVADECGVADPERRSALLAGLADVPAAMDRVLALRDVVADGAARFAPSRRHWAVVGNGPNRVAAQEIRIKLSELCYRSISCDATEDKKHIDLSAEPLILVCAAGLAGATAADVAKEVAIYRAHKAAPEVIGTEGTSFPAALQTIEVPTVHPSLAFVLCAMVGHLFGYEAALSIDGQARLLREARGAIEAAVSGAAGDGRRAAPEQVLDRLARTIEPVAARFFEQLRAGAYNGNLEASTAVRLASLLRYASGALPLEAYEIEYGKVGTPGVLLDDLTDALTRAIEELTRPIDAIKHQAKTVTVGISRSEDALFGTELVRRLLAAGALRDRLSYRALRTVAQLDPAVAEVTGYTRYRVEGSVADGTATIHVVDKGGIARDLSSRTERQPGLRGTKHRAAEEREVTVARGRYDGRSVVLVPEAKDNQVTGLTLLHIRFHEHLPAEAMRSVLAGYRNRYSALVDAVTETEPAFDDARLGAVPVLDLLVDPVHLLADRWRTA